MQNPSDDEASDFTLAAIATAIIPSIGAMSGTTLHSILGRDGYPMGIFIGYIISFFILLGAIKTDPWRQKHNGKLGAKIHDTISVVAPILTMILCAALIPWTEFHSLPQGKAHFTTGITLIILFGTFIGFLRLTDTEKINYRRIAIDLAITALILSGGIATGMGYQPGIILTITGLAILLIRFLIRQYRRGTQRDEG